MSTNGHAVDDINALFAEADDDYSAIQFPERITTGIDPLDVTDEEAERIAREQVEAGSIGNVTNARKRDDAPTKPATELFGGLMDRLRRREGDKLLSLPGVLEGFEVGPKLISVVGAPPGAGKTVLAGQCLFDGLQSDPDLTALVANAEMTWDVLARRELARKTGISDNDLRFARVTDHDIERIEAAARDLMPLMDRIQVMAPPFTSDRVDAAAAKMRPGLVILDYLQKFSAPGDAVREGVNATMATLRCLAMDGWAVLALSATSRSQAKGGSSHDAKNLSLASFRESGEVEFNADACYLLKDQGPYQDRTWQRQVLLECAKNRNGEKISKLLLLDYPRMQFLPLPSNESTVEAFEWDPSDDPATDFDTF